MKRMIFPILQNSATSCDYLSGPKLRAWRGALFLLLVGTVVLVPSLAIAAPSNGQVWTFHQPDGTPFQARAIGDEFFAYYETPDGSVIQEDASSRYWYYSVPKSDGSLIRSEFRVGEAIPKSVVLNAEKGAWLEASEQIATRRSDELRYGAERLTPATGTVRGVLLFANFSDTSTTFTGADLNDLLNTVGYNSNGALGSVRDYYYENSYGALTLQIDVYTCTLPQTRAWYGQNTGGAGSDANARQMISDAIAAVDASVDFSIYDADGDGRVDIFGVAHQGQGEESGGGTNAIWSHSGNLASAVVVDGKTIRNYFTVPERYGATTLSTIGVYCHEMAHHMFSLPDLYDLDGGSNGVGSWSLMGYGGWLGPNGAKPCHLDPWCKMALGWLTPTRVTSAQSGIALPNFDENASALLIPIDPYQDGEYFLVSNRYKRSTAAASTGFDQYLPGSGALILHIDDYVRDNKVETLKKVDVEEADGNNHLDNQANLGDSNDLYPNGASAFTNASTPNTKANDGTSTGIVVDTFTGAGTALMTCSVTPMPGVGTYLGYDAMGTSGNGYGFNGIDYGVVHFTTATGGTLERVRTYFLFPGTTNYTIDVFSGWSGGAPTGLLTTQSGSRAGRGPVEIPLTTPQNFAPGSDFYIRVKYDSGYFLQYVLPIESDAYCDGRSWVSNDGITYIQMTQANNLPYDLNLRADFSTGLSAGPITATTPSPTNGSTIEFSVEFSADVQNFNDDADLVITETGTVTNTGTSISGGPKSFTVFVTGVSGDGTMTLAVNTLSDVQDTSGNPLAFSATSAAVTVDHTAPGPPNVSGFTPTGDSTPTWSWSSTGGGNGSYRYKLDDSDLTSGATTTTGTTFTPASPLADAAYTLYVQERDDVGNWSASGSFTITIDTSGLYPPIVSGLTPTNDTTPTWTWISSEGIGSGNYRYQLNSESGTWTTTTNTLYSPGAALPEGDHTLYVQEEDGPNNWSDSGSFTITIDTTGPGGPTVSGTTPTNDTTPTWTWFSGGGGNGTYRYKLDDSDLTTGATSTTATMFTPISPLSDAAHTLYVQESDDAGNWSVTGAFAITVYAGYYPPGVSALSVPRFTE